jgi:hypothetical protein
VVFIYTKAIMHFQAVTHVGHVWGWKLAVQAPPIVRRSCKVYGARSVTTAGSPPGTGASPDSHHYTSASCPSNTDPEVFKKHVQPEWHQKLQTTSRYPFWIWLRSEWVSLWGPRPSVHSNRDKYYRHW